MIERSADISKQRKTKEKKEKDKRRRPRIDRSQIGLPTNFQHTGHIGSGEVATGFDVHQVQNSMQSKGGYSESGGSDLHTPDGIDVSQINSSKNEDNMKSSSPNEITITLNADDS